MNTKTLVLVALFVLILPQTFAYLKLDNVQFDPAIISSGDEVDIVIQYHDEPTVEEDSRIGQPGYTFEVRLEPDDTLAQTYLTFVDAEGDDYRGQVLAGARYNKVFRVKVNNNAPAGNYQVKLIGQWYYNDKPIDDSQVARFRIPVKREGIILDIATLHTVPNDVRPGDNYVEINTRVENVGQKDAKSVEMHLNTPEEIEASYANNNRVWIGRVNSGESKDITFVVDVDEYAAPEAYDVRVDFSYRDLDDNAYSKSRELPFLIKGRPYLEVSGFAGQGRAGDDGTLIVTVKNTGTQSAEAVDVRILKQNSQPFTFDVRNDYVGELEPGEEREAIFHFDVSRDAAHKTHDFQLLIRAKGDSDEGDDTIYTYNRRAQFVVSGSAPNYFFYLGLAVLGSIGGGYLITRKQKKRAKVRS